jgi:nitrite reductase/ring-hydroxylating ferredoxin subunit
MLPNKLKAIGSSEALREVAYREESIILKGQPTTALIFMFDGKLYSYVNHCMHMQRRLNCEQTAIFDDTGRYLRCSMHGFIFDPTTGECQSPVCFGQRLQALRVEEIDGTVYFAEKHLTLND